MVRGAVGIAQDTVRELSKSGIVMSDKNKFELVSNIIIVTCGNKTTVS